ncbi:MAG: hypothetical protein AAFQ64_18810 [Pseudomonadota bacterium]
MANDVTGLAVSPDEMTGPGPGAPGPEVFADLLQGAIERAAIRPTAEGALPSDVELLTEAGIGPVGEARSRVDPEARASEADTKEGLQAESEARMRSLYLDLTNYQIAWRIAQRMQQDISQLLRGT